MTVTGMLFGKVLAGIFGKKVEIFGGIVLIAIGIKILIDRSSLNYCRDYFYACGFGPKGGSGQFMAKETTRSISASLVVMV